MSLSNLLSPTCHMLVLLKTWHKHLDHGSSFAQYLEANVPTFPLHGHSSPIYSIMMTFAENWKLFSIIGAE